jgi:hypothetical protein
LKSKRVVDGAAIQDLAKKYDMKYVETSALEGTGFEDFERAVVQTLLEEKKQQPPVKT